MKTFYKSLKYVVVLAMMATASGCATGPMAKAVTKAYNFGQDLPAEMVNRHIAGWVGFDEQWADSYTRPARNALYVQGVAEGTPEYSMRVARVNLSNSLPGVLWVDQGQLQVMTGAMVPDHLPQLHAGDIVEIRQTGTYDTMKNFTVSGEGNVVVRILCQKGTPNYEACLDSAPKIGKYKGVGETHTPYPVSARDYGFTFTPMFDEKGRALRPYPQEPTKDSNEKGSP